MAFMTNQYKPESLQLKQALLENYTSTDPVIVQSACMSVLKLNDPIMCILATFDRIAWSRGVPALT